MSKEKEIAKREESLLKYTGPDQMVWAQDKWKSLKENPVHQVKFDTGFKDLDKLVDGVCGGEVIVVSGKIKNGKTLLLQSLTHNFQQQEIVSTWFSYEVMAPQFLSQMPASTLTGFTMPDVITDNAMTWIRDRLEETKLKHNARIAFIDHLHYLFDLGSGRNPSLEIGAVVRSLKRMAIDLNIVIFLVCHVAKIPMGDEATEANLRDSSLVAAEADSTWMVTRLLNKKEYDDDPDEYSDITKVSVRNHRRTGVMAKSIRLIKRGFLLEQYSEYGEEPINVPKQKPEHKPKKKQEETLWGNEKPF